MANLTRNVSMRLDRETKGALRYQEVDAKGNAVIDDAGGAILGTQYLRKAQVQKWIGTENWPQKLTITLVAEGVVAKGDPKPAGNVSTLRKRG